MGITRTEFSTLVKGMKAIYPQATFIPDQDAFNVWYELLKDIDYESLSASIQKHMMVSPYVPTPADLREGAAAITSTAQDMTELEAWSLVRKAVRNSTYNATEEFNKLPKLVQKAVGSPENLKEWGQMDIDEFETVQESLFSRNYTTMCKRQKDLDSMSPSVRVLLEHTTQTMALPNKVPENQTAIESKGESIPAPDWVREKMEELVRKEK